MAVAVLKVCNSYTVDDVEAQARVSAHVREHGFKQACAPQRRRGVEPSGAQFTTTAADGTPCCLLSWVEGVAADKVVAAGTVAPEAVLRAIGQGLAELHRVPVDAAAALRTIETGGGCDVRLHLSGELLALFRSNEHASGHDFLPFYERQLECLQKAMGADLPRGVLHGDPFLDNVLVDGASGALCGFVDLEDVTVGPCLFDAACCACACCFDASTNTLDIGRLRALLGGYNGQRPLAAAERSRFVDFMKLTMLCNCTWRFKNFNIDHRELEECRDAHRELQQRILELERPEVAAEVAAVIGEL